MQTRGDTGAAYDLNPLMGNLGIAYADLCQLRPDIVLVSMSAYGATGPWSPVPGIGGTIEPSSGMSALLGYPGGPPLNSGHMYPNAAFAAVARVLRADDSAPGDAELADAWFATAAGRLAHEDALEAAITRQTTKRDKRELADALTAAGAIAAPVLDVGEVLADPGPVDRGVLRPVTHSLAGPAIQVGLPLRMARTPLPPWAPPRCTARTHWRSCGRNSGWG